MFPSDAYGKESSERKMNKESCGSEVFVVNSEHDVILYLAIEISPLVFFPKNAHISPVDLRNAGQVLIWQVMLLWQEGYTPVLTHVLSHSYTNPHKTYLFAAKKITLQMLFSNWGSWEGVQRKKNEPEWPSSQERNVILHPSIGFVFPLTLSKRSSSTWEIVQSYSGFGRLCGWSPWLHRVMVLWWFSLLYCSHHPLHRHTHTHAAFSH